MDGQTRMHSEALFGGAVIFRRKFRETNPWRAIRCGGQSLEERKRPWAEGQTPPDASSRYVTVSD